MEQKTSAGHSQALPWHPEKRGRLCPFWGQLGREPTEQCSVFDGGATWPTRPMMELLKQGVRDSFSFGGSWRAELLTDLS